MTFAYDYMGLQIHLWPSDWCAKSLVFTNNARFLIYLVSLFVYFCNYWIDVYIYHIFIYLQIIFNVHVLVN